MYEYYDWARGPDVVTNFFFTRSPLSAGMVLAFVKGLEPFTNLVVCIYIS